MTDQISTVPMDAKLLDERIATERDADNRRTLEAIRFTRRHPDDVLAVLTLVRRMGKSTDDPAVVVRWIVELTQ